MELPTEEQRRWRELTAELRHDRRLAAHAARFETIVRWRSNLAIAAAGIAIPAVAWIPATAGGCTGIALLTAGALTRSSGLSVAGIAVMVVTLLLAGAALVTIGIAGCKNTGGRADLGPH